MLLAFAGWSEQCDLGLSVDQHIVLDAMTFFLAAVENGLDFWVFGSLNRPFCAILEEKLPFFRCQMQFLDIASGSLTNCRQGLVQARMQNVYPLVDYGLRHSENFSKNVLGRRFTQIHQDKQKLIFDHAQRAVAILYIMPLATFFPFQRVYFDMLQKTGPKGRQQRLKFFRCASSQRKKLFPLLGKSGIIDYEGLLP